MRYRGAQAQKGSDGNSSCPKSFAVLSLTYNEYRGNHAGITRESRGDGANTGQHGMQGGYREEAERRLKGRGKIVDNC